MVRSNQSNPRERPRTSKQPAHQTPATDVDKSAKHTEERKSSNRANVLPQP